MRKIVCPDCGGNLVFEELCQCSVLYKVGSTGKIYKRGKKVDQGTLEIIYLYCGKCGRRVDFDKCTLNEFGDRITRLND